MIRRPPRSTLFPTRRSSDLGQAAACPHCKTPYQAAAGGGSLDFDDFFELTDKGKDAPKPPPAAPVAAAPSAPPPDRKSTRLNSSHVEISYAVFCLKKKKKQK